MAEKKLDDQLYSINTIADELRESWEIVGGGTRGQI